MQDPSTWGSGHRFTTVREIRIDLWQRLGKVFTPEGNIGTETVVNHDVKGEQGYEDNERFRI